MKFSFLILSVFMVLQSANALPPGMMRMKQFQIQTLGTETGNFNQLINHFSKLDVMPTEADYFKQRYFIDSSLARGKDSPVIYYICGEATCEGATSSALVNALAKEIGAHRVALEHRYYGYSQPFKRMTPENLRFLSVEQALEDLAVFQRHLQASMGLTGKWIAVGGSYAGELAAFYRQNYPELAAGALASSGPVLAKADFEEYDHHIAKVATPACLAAIQAAVKDVEQRLLDPESKKAVKALFKASNVSNDIDFMYNLADQAAIAVQYGYQDEFCRVVTKGMNEGKVTEAYAQIGSSLFERFGMTAFQDAFESALEMDPEYYVSWFGYRAWLYQSCTQFGFYQIAYHNPAQSSRSSKIDEQYHNDTCDRLFGIKTPVDTATTNLRYYAPLLTPASTHILYTNGSNDPWSNLSITDATPGIENNPNLNLFVISGAAHCDDLGSRLSTSLTQARNQFKSLVNEWLK